MLISETQKNGDAAKKGVKPGDVILEIDRLPVKSTADFDKWRVLSLERGESSALLRIERDGEQFFVVVDLIAGEP